MNKLSFVAALAAVASTAAQAQAPKLPEYLKGINASVAVKGTSATITLKIDVAPGWHIWANKPGDENAIPTVVDVKAPAGVKVGKAVYPAGHPYPAGGKIYEGPTTVTVPVTLAKPGKAALTLTLKAQGCNATSCLPPVSIPIAVSIAGK